MKKAVIYARVSSKEQEKEGYSIPAQLSLLSEYALKNGITIVREFVEAESAKVAGRVQFLEMINFLKLNQEIKDILVEKTDRLTRNFRDVVLVDPDSTGFNIHLVKQGQILSKDSKSSEKLMWGIHTTLAKHHSDNLSEEVRKGMSEKARQGLYPSQAPFGYRNRLSDHTIEPDPMRSPYVVRAFEMMAYENVSLGIVAKTLNESGARTIKNARLSKSQLQAILKRPLYYGQFYWNGTLYNGKHTPLIGKKLFDLAQVAMRTRQKPKLIKHESSFSGLITCGDCGCAITPDIKTKPNGRRYVYYRCTNGKRQCSSVVYLREEIIRDAFAEALIRIQITPAALELTRRTLLSNAQAEREFREQAIQNLNQEISKLQRRIDRCYTDHLDGKISAEEWESHTSRWKTERDELRMKLQAHDCADMKYMQEGVRLLELASQAHSLFTNAMTPSERREIVSLVLSNPRIENGTIRYDYKMPFKMMVNSTEKENWLGR